MYRPWQMIQLFIGASKADLGAEQLWQDHAGVDMVFFFFLFYFKDGHVPVDKILFAETP